MSDEGMLHALTEKVGEAIEVKAPPPHPLVAFRREREAVEREQREARAEARESWQPRLTSSAERRLVNDGSSAHERLTRTEPATSPWVDPPELDEDAAEERGKASLRAKTVARIRRDAKCMRRLRIASPARQRRYQRRQLGQAFMLMQLDGEMEISPERLQQKLAEALREG